MRNRPSSRRVVGYALAVIALAAGLWASRDRLAGFDPFDHGRPVTLTGVGRTGQVEVPVINLWGQPGFGRDNQVAARVQLPATGQVEANLVSQMQIDGLTWDELQVRDARGWVVSRFVAE